MKNIRKIEILKEVIRKLTENTNYSAGICHHLRYSATDEEFSEINDFFLSNKPTEIVSEKYWWTMDEKGHSERISFLEKLIEKL